MATIQTQLGIVHLDSGLNTSSAVQRTAAESAFNSNAITVTASDETLAMGDIITPQQVILKLVSGDDLRVGLDGSTYPFRLRVAGESALLPLDVEGLQETSTVTAIADVARSLSGDYLDLTDRTGTVRVWFNMAGVAASGTIIYGTPGVAVAATGTVTIVDYSLLAGAVITIDGNGFTEGVDWTAATNNNTTAASLAAAVDALGGVGATAVATNIVSITATAGYAGNYTLTTSDGTNAPLSGATLAGGLDATALVVNSNQYTYAVSPGANEFSTIGQLTALIEADVDLTATDDGTGISIVAAVAGTAGNTLGMALVNDSVDGGMLFPNTNLLGGVDASTPPATPGGGRLFPVVIVEDATADTNATAIATALEDDDEFTASATTNVVTVTDLHTGTRTNITAGTSGMAVATTQEGAPSPIIHLKSLGTSQVVVVVAPN